MLAKPFPQVHGLDFHNEDVLEALSMQRMLMLTIFTGPTCNLQCPYCFAAGWHDFRPQMKLSDYVHLLSEAKDLGASSVWWVGQGEPFLVWFWRDLILACQKNSLYIGIFTNGTKLDDESAQFLLDHSVALYMKLNSFNSEIQGNLIGGNGQTFLNRVVPRIEWFVKTGMAKSRRLAVESVVTRMNYDEIPGLFRWCRDREIIPFVEMLEHAGQGPIKLDVTPEEHVALFKELQRIDRKQYGYEWELIPPWAAYRCRNLYLGLAVDSWGNVTPCSGMRYRLGNIREKSLAEIWNSDQAKMFRDPSRMEPYPWDGKSLGRYGCKSHAYHVTGDPFAIDPRCEWFRESDKRSLADNSGNLVQAGGSQGERAV